jgi:hypothetical protein
METDIILGNYADSMKHLGHNTNDFSSSEKVKSTKGFSLDQPKREVIIADVITSNKKKI